MPPIQTVEEAFQRADTFLSRYFTFKRPLSAQKEGASWHLVYDVGVFGIEKVQLTIDATSGFVTEYTDRRGA